MDLYISKLNAIQLFDFSKEEENLIFKVYDKLCEFYDISVVESKDPLYNT